MDALSHINHTSYLSYMESARVDVYLELGFSGIRREMDESTILASMDVHYIEQASHPSTLEIGHRICRVGNKSFDFISVVFNKKNKRLLCSALFKLVAYNYKIDQTIPVPDVIRQRCRPFE
jgi:acyl-CoA thioester hydrolase